ncbi:MAG: hypothetical protein E7603_07530 [Ruminococcaceae bacterium]|nr:hypothetical protein [Oscillospiraceae bacterium]
MKIGYMIVGCIFLCNPFIHIIDILPDFIGYLFILKALSELSDLERNICNARKRFQSALWVSLVKCALVFGFMIYDSTWYLILTFSFAVLECMYLIPAFADLFYGISYLEERHTNHKSRFEAMTKFGGIFDKTEFAGGTAYFEVFEDKQNETSSLFAREKVFFADGSATVSLSEAGFASRFREKIVYLYESAEARTLSVIFVIVRAVCSILPELTAIAETGDGYVESNPIEDFSALRWILILFLAVFSLAVGIVWLVRMIRYFNVFRKDREFIGALQKKYEAEVLPNRGLWIKRKSLAFCAVATAAYAFLMYLRIDWFLLVPKWESGEFRFAVYDLFGFFPVPEFLFGAVMIFAGIAAKDFAQRKKELTKSSVVFIVSSLLSYVVMTFISLHFGRILYPYNEIPYVILFVLYLLLFSVSMVMFVKISREKKYIYQRIASEIAEISCPCIHEFSDRRRAELVETFELKIKRLHILEKIYAVFSVAAVVCLPFAGDYDIFGLAWFFRMIFGIALIVYSLFLTDALQKEIEKIVE